MPRVYELARQLEVPSSTVLQVISGLTPNPPTSASGAVPEELVDEVAELVRSTVIRHGEGARLIRQAFEVARLSGKAETPVMSSAVLKNRILDLTHRAFQEADFGVSSFQAWLDLFPDVVEVDRAQRPPWIRLLDADESAGDADKAPSGAAEISLPERWRIRSDLWRAVMDVDRVGFWVWDGDVAQSRPATEHGEHADLAVLPTLRSEELRAWRSAFASRVLASTPSRAPLERWAADPIPDAALPYHTRGQWIAALKRNVLVRLHDWFAGQELTAPSDLVEDVTSRTTEEPLERMRSLIIRCVQEMTRSELEGLALPPASVMRISSR